MDRYAVIKKFFSALEKLDHTEIMKFFETNATIYSPLYDKKGASLFYTDFIEGTEKMDVEIKNIFQSVDHPHTMAAHIRFAWTPAGFETIHAECVNIFSFLPTKEKIDSLKIIYDTVVSRPIFEKMHK